MISWIGHISKVQQRKYEEEHSFLCNIFQRHSTWTKVIRILSWIRRPYLILKHSQSYHNDQKLSVEEIPDAKEFCIRIVRRCEFESELAAIQESSSISLSSPLCTVNPFVDCNSVLRANGRLANSTWPFPTKYPIILPRKSRLTKLIILHQLWHSSVERTLAQLCQSYWIPVGRATVRSALNQCFSCKKRNAHPQLPLMSALLACRVEQFEPAFTTTGIDFFGTLQVIIHRRTHKRYGCLYHSLDTSSFLVSFRWFVNRVNRGYPKTCYSDNGTYLVSGEREMRESFNHHDRRRSSFKFLSFDSCVSRSFRSRCIDS